MLQLDTTQTNEIDERNRTLNTCGTLVEDPQEVERERRERNSSGIPPAGWSSVLVDQDKTATKRPKISERP